MLGRESLYEIEKEQKNLKYINKPRTEPDINEIKCKKEKCKSGISKAQVQN